jgi:hypothetical protein
MPALKWTREAVITSIQTWEDLYGSPPRATDWNPAMIKTDDGGKARKIFNDNGMWPHVTTICRMFGSWNAGIEAAGFKPRSTGQRGPNRGKRRN